MNSQLTTDILAGGISLFFPAFNEATNVGGTIEKALAVLEPLSCRCEVIIVDDGSRDRTAAIVQEYAAVHPQVILKQHPVNLGYGVALRTGLQACAYDLIFFSDCDLQFDLGELRSLLAIMQANPTLDAVIGYRLKRADPVFRRLNAYGWKIWSKLLFGVKVKDVDCAFKLFRREIFANLRIESTSALINLEILAKLQKLGCRLTEVGVHHYPRMGGAQTGAKLKVILKAFQESFTLYKQIKGFPLKNIIHEK
jgi:glycosyltransferase involved in cell wall biosynthesis